VVFYKWSWLRQIFDVAGGATGTVLAAIAGLSIVTAIVGFFTEHPSVAIMLSVVVAYYGFRLFERLREWWRRESVETKLLIQPLVPVVISRDDAAGTCRISIVFKVTNTAPFDVWYVEDEEDFWVGTAHAQQVARTPPEVYLPNQVAIKGSRPITVPLRSSDQGNARFHFSMR
jgi:hypothetical protein